MSVLQFPAKPTQINRIRSRDEALAYLIPQMLGLLWSRGDTDPLGVHGGAVVRLENGLVLGGFSVVRGSFGVHVYDPSSTKVFSARLAERAAVTRDDSRYRYHEGRCCILSWRRGPWENDIVAERADPRTIAHVLVGGLSKMR